jgi:hypothetical protein
MKIFHSGHRLKSVPPVINDLAAGMKIFHSGHRLKSVPPVAKSEKRGRPSAQIPFYSSIRAPKSSLFT